MLGGRRDSRYGQLVRRGFTEPAAAERLLALKDLDEVRGDTGLLDAFGGTADPDLALIGLVRLVEAQHDPQPLLDTLLASKPLRDRLLSVLGASEALGDHLAGHPDDWKALVTYEAADLHPGVEEFEAAVGAAVDPDDLRHRYRGCLLSIAARDMCGTSDLAETAAELADLATATLRAALALARRAAPDDARACRLAVIGMGKCGGRELNYVSDVDVIFVAEPADGAAEAEALQAATRLAAHLMRIC
ncbi:MAG: bifunctional [glutamine synthetase] adenylyltransferase/[glutamine synthetase]-adenylyl-L-tyrosine phosphorylase, partial [Streptomyces sp.]